MRVSGWLLALALLPAAPALAQEPSVRGVVVDARTRSPIAGARVQSGRAGSAETGADGAFVLPVGPGDTLRAAALGYGRATVPLGAADSVVTIALAPLTTVLPDLVVTTSRREQRAAQTAVPVTTLDRGEIDAAAAASVDRLVGELPGVQLLPTNPTGANLSIRGVDGPRVLVLVDGEPISGNLLENRDLSRLSTLAVDRIEVVKGPLSALYGSDALGGVVNVVTRDPDGPLTLGVDGRIGDGGRREGAVTAESGGPVSYRLSGGWREDRRVASVDQPDDAFARVWDLRGTVRAAAGSRVRLRGDVSLLRERQRWQLSADGFNGFNDNVGANGFVEAVWSLGQDALRSRLYLEHYSHRFRQARGDQPLATDSTEIQREDMAKVSAIYSLALGAQVLDLGADLSHRRIEAPGKLDGAIDDEVVEGYAQTGWRLGEVLLNPAARVSWNSRWGAAFTPSVAAAWDATPSLRFRAGVARGFRGPSFKELAWDFPNPFAGYTIRGDPGLTPERSWQTSAGLSWSAGGGIVLSGEAYRNSIRDLIELTAAGTDAGSGLLVFSPRNVRRARTQGVELGAHWADADWLASAEYNYLDAEDLATGARLDRRAHHGARLRLGRELAAPGRLRADLTLAYTGSAPAQQPDGSAGRQDDLLSTNAQVQWQAYDDVSIGVGVDNLFDARPSGWTGLVGRRVYLGLGTSLHP